MHVKIILNGNGFYSGRLIASYIPRPTEALGISLPRELFPQDNIQMSQLPHVLLDPTTSQGGELQLPFFHSYNNLCIPANEFAQMGVLVIRQLNPLQHANGGTDPVTVSVFCWAEDVQLSIPTSTRNAAVLPQMGDEYGLKPVSKTAATIARAAGALSKIPTIAPYAKATQEAANAVSNVAAIFGYSRPATLDSPSKVAPEFAGNLANTNMPEHVTKLTLDAKQEVTVDPRVVGLGDADEMSILSIAKREAYLTQWEWTTADPADSLLGSLVVSPMAFFTQGAEHILTPIAFATLPFRYWRGTIKYRFQVVCSSFHKGRLRVIYDPYLLQPGSISEYNVNYSYVVDIATERDFTIAVGWGQPTTWRSVTDLLGTAYPTGRPGNNIIPSSADTLQSNGALSLAVVNDLTVPNNVDPHPIMVNVWISAGDDFEVCVPLCANIDGLSFSNISTAPGIVEPPVEEIMEAQAGDTADPIDEANEDAPVSAAVSHTLANSMPLKDHTLDVFFGDPVVSFRQCLKRYNFSMAHPVYSFISGGHYRHTRLVLPDIPLFRGAVGGAIHNSVNPSTGSPMAWNYCKMTLLNYLLPAYAARRGGIKWKYVMCGRQPASLQMSVTAGTEGLGYSLTSDTWGDAGGTNPNGRAYQHDLLLPHTWCATHVTPTANNPVLEVELPYYTNRRFYPARHINVTSAGQFNTSYHTLRITHQPIANEVCSVRAYVSTAEDFNLFFFCYVPALYTVATPLSLG